MESTKEKQPKKHNRITKQTKEIQGQIPPESTGERTRTKQKKMHSPHGEAK